MTLHTFWNTTDHSVTVDDEGRQVDGGARAILESDTKQVQDAVRLGLLMDQGPYEDDTNQSSAENQSSTETLDDSTASTKKSSTKSKEK